MKYSQLAKLHDLYKKHVPEEVDKGSKIYFCKNCYLPVLTDGKFDVSKLSDELYIATLESLKSDIGQEDWIELIADIAEYTQNPNFIRMIRNEFTYDPPQTLLKKLLEIGGMIGYTTLTLFQHNIEFKVDETIRKAIIKTPNIAYNMLVYYDKERMDDTYQMSRRDPMIATFYDAYIKRLGR